MENKRNRPKTIDRKYHSLIRQKIEEQLLSEPTVVTRNRRPLKRSILGAEWKIRFGPENQFRVFYTVDPAQGKVYIRAIGEKRGNRLYVGGEEVVS